MTERDFGGLDGPPLEYEQVGNRRTLERLPGSGYAYMLVDDAVRIEARYLRRDHGAPCAEADVQCEWAGVSRHGNSLSCADLNLSSQTARKSLAKYCAERLRTREDGFDWMGAIDAACLEVIRAERRGDDVIERTADRHKGRKRRLFGPERIPRLHYLRCRAPLTVELDPIRRYCDGQRIDFLAVDSVGLACDGKAQ
jgi:hypothetical protein